MDASSKKIPIKTVARVRPRFDGTNLQSSLIIDSENSIITVKSKNKEFHLDNVFDENATQETIYDTVAQPNKICETSDSPTCGIIPRSIESIFEFLYDRLKKDPQFKFSIKFSYIEVYKKDSYDLLQSNGATVNIQASGEEIIITGTAEFVVTSVEECLHHLQNGWKNRKTAETSMNRESSRSHAIFMLTLVTEKIGVGSFNDVILRIFF